MTKTDADLSLDKVRNDIRSAIYNLSSIVITECYGAEEYTQEFRDTMQSCLNDMINIRKRLK